MTAVQPFPNHSSDVAADTKEIIVTFDKPLIPGNYSINRGPAGKEHYPISGNPEFLPGNRSIKLRVELKPEWTYDFVLTPLAFRSTDGYPLVSFEIAFTTKP